ncbi:pollen receptor-like kinase 1 [Malania oleifera]|uniref:pollen receptor-like kinase 1 n=1 Tax=Malania oleifera TaxID=397392 RepID=UPI0025ADFB9C|nr:pollen receptor-like kinase 1 [Malania oleifera]
MPLKLLHPPQRPSSPLQPRQPSSNPTAPVEGTHAAPPVRAPPHTIIAASMAPTASRTAFNMIKQNRAPPSTLHPLLQLRLPTLTVFILVVLSNVDPGMAAAGSAASSSPESEALRSFISQFDSPGGLAPWLSDTSSPCRGNKANWDGLVCNGGSVWVLQAENKGLKSDALSLEALRRLPNLRSLSLKSNNLSGHLPNISTILPALKSIYLSDNQFDGEIAGGAFAGMLNLKKVHLANNRLSGKIPESLTRLPRLLELELENNRFAGRIPDFHNDKKLYLVNVSNNLLEGPIPPTISKMDPTNFSGNRGLCGAPLANICPVANASSTNSGHNGGSGGSKTSTVVITAVAVVVAVIALVAICALTIVILRSHQRSARHQLPLAAEGRPLPSSLGKKVGSGELDQMEQGKKGGAGGGQAAGGRLSFVRQDREKFELGELLKASAEIMGSGCFGSSYKAALVNGPVMVVKRFKEMNNVGREEFQEHMRRLGKLTHPNLLPLVAYYYRQEEKLLVTDFVHNGSLAVRLHGNNAQGVPSLDWPSRLKIVKGVGRGLAYLHGELSSLVTPHGHLKSSNVLLNESFEPLLADYGLVPLTNQEHAQDFLVAYKSPEYRDLHRVTKRTDVWSLGVLIIEILTARFPANYMLQRGQGKGSEESDLARWVSSVAQEAEASGAEVLDKAMGGGRSVGSEREMMKLLRIGLACCVGDVEKRWDMKEAVERIEEVREGFDDQEFYSSRSFAITEVDNDKFHSTRKLSDDFDM